MQIKSLLFAAATVATLCCSFNVNAEPEKLDAIVAVVNDDVILASELISELRTVTMRLRQQQRNLPDSSVLKTQLLERLVLVKLQLQQAKRAGIRVDEETLNSAMRNIARNNKLSLREFRTALANEGIDYADFREQLRQQIIVEQLKRRMVDSRVRVSDQEISNFLLNQKDNNQSSETQWQLAQILIALPDEPSADDLKNAKLEADEILERLNAGEKFSDLAISESDGRNALEGGLLGWFKYGQIPTIFADVVEDMKAGDVSQPIKSPSGYHIVTVVDSKQTALRTVKQTLARHILMVPNQLQDDTSTQLKLETVRERILNGEDFAALAKAQSDDKGSAVEGGDLGWASPGKFVPEFQEQIDKLSKSEISPVFKSRFGYHIVQLLDTRNYDDTEEFQRNQAAEQIRQRKSLQQEAEWLRRLRGEAFVDIRLNKHL